MFPSPGFDVSYICCTNQSFHVEYKNTLTSFKVNQIRKKISKYNWPFMKNWVIYLAAFADGGFDAYIRSLSIHASMMPSKHVLFSNAAPPEQNPGSKH